MWREKKIIIKMNFYIYTFNFAKINNFCLNYNFFIFWKISISISVIRGYFKCWICYKFASSTTRVQPIFIYNYYILKFLFALCFWFFRIKKENLLKLFSDKNGQKIYVNKIMFKNYLFKFFAPFFISYYIVYLIRYVLL